jgi:hypothetical protein
MEGLVIYVGLNHEWAVSLMVESNRGALYEDYRIGEYNPSTEEMQISPKLLIQW